MNYISNYTLFVNEGLRSRKLKNPHVLIAKAESAYSEPIEGGVVLILSNPIFNGKRRIYMGIIDKIMYNKLPETYGVTLTGNYYILKEHLGGNIMPEKIGYLDAEKRMYILNMTTNGLYLNDSKTPLWRTSISMNKIKFFTNYQSLLNELTTLYDVEIPFTQMKRPVNLHE